MSGSELVDESLLLAGDTASLAGATDLAANLDASAELAALGIDTIQSGDLVNGTALLSDTVTTTLTGGDTLASATTDAAVEQAVVDAAVE